MRLRAESAQGARGTLASPSDGGKNSGSPAAAVNAAVDILNKPNPAYSSEARTMRLEGDVVLEVVFLASGQVKVIRVLSGLGHGLDEAATQAAERISFKPALRNGQPIDHRAEGLGVQRGVRPAPNPASDPFVKLFHEGNSP